MPKPAPPVRKATPRGRPPSEDLHRRLLDSATTLFARSGPERTSTRDVAALSGTTERTLFKHFGSKDGLVEAVLAEAVLAHSVPDSLAGLRLSIEACRDDFEAWHRDLLRDRLADWRKGSGLTRFLAIELLRNPRHLERFAEQWLPAAWTPLVSLFAELQREARLRDDLDAAVLARQFMGINLSFLITRLMLAPDFDWNDEAEIAAIARVFRSGAGRREGT